MRKLLTIMLMSASMGMANAVFAQDFARGTKAYEAKDYGTALKEIRPLAEQGHAGAQFLMGTMYRYGMGVTQSYKEEYRWNIKAAEKGYVGAHFELGWMYDKGQGVLQDNVYAHMWYNIAASNGETMGETLREEIAKKMTASDLSKAQDLARVCVKKQYKDC